MTTAWIHEGIIIAFGTPYRNVTAAGQSAIRLLRQNTVELLVLLEIVIQNVEYYNDYSVKSGTIRNRLLAG